MRDEYAITLLQDRANLELEFEKWRGSQIPKVQRSVQAFISFLAKNELIDNDKVHAFIREKGG